MAGRPRSFDRDAALAVAVDLFWREGYDRTSIAMLTTAMGVTPPSLYAAFGDKHRLFDEASAAYFDRTLGAVEANMDLPTVRQALTRLLVDTARAHTDPRTPRGCLSLTEPRLAAHRDTMRERLRARFARGVADGDLPEHVDPSRMAGYILAVLAGMSGCARDGGTREDLTAIADQALATLGDG